MATGYNDWFNVSKVCMNVGNNNKLIRNGYVVCNVCMYVRLSQMYHDKNKEIGIVPIPGYIKM